MVLKFLDPGDSCFRDDCISMYRARSNRGDYRGVYQEGVWAVGGKDKLEYETDKCREIPA